MASLKTVITEIVIISLFAFELIMLAFSNSAVWLDETYSLAAINHSFKDILIFESSDVHPPLYFLIAKCWGLVFGNSIFLLKLLSIVPILLTMIIGARFFNKEISRISGIIFLFCFAASQTIVHYSIEIRMYSWALFFVTMAVFSMWYIITRGRRRWWIVFILFAEAAAYTHYYAAAIIGIGYLIFLVYIFKYDKATLNKLIIAAVAAIVLYVPWLPYFIANFIKSSNDFWIPPISLKTLVGYILFLFNGGSTVSTMLLFLLFCFTVGVFLKKEKTMNDLFSLAGVCSFFILAFIGILVSFLTRPLLVGRYLFPGMGLLFIFIALELGMFPGKKIILPIIVLFVGCNILSFVSQIRAERIEQSNFNQFYDYIVKNMKEDDVFMYAKNQPEHVADQLMGICAYLFPEHSHVYELKKATDVKLFGEQNYWKMFNSSGLPYDSGALDENLKERRAWLLVMRHDLSNKPLETLPLRGAEACGLFGWGSYQFNVYTGTVGALFNDIEGI